MRSDRIKKGPQRGPHRSLLKATGLADGDIRKPFIAVVNSYNDIVPGQDHSPEDSIAACRNKLVVDCVEDTIGTRPQKQVVRTQVH